MSQNEPQSAVQSARLIIVSLVAVIIVVGLALVVMVIGRSGSSAAVEEEVNALANSDDDCVVCHTRTTPGIVDQYGHSTMAAAEVTCRDCHEVDADYPGAVQRQGAERTGAVSQPVFQSPPHGILRPPATGTH